MAQCALSGDTYPVSQMVRIVYNADYGWGVDAKGNLPADGWWVVPKAIWLRVRADEVFGATIELPVDVDGLIACLDRHLLLQVQSLLSLARRASVFCLGGEQLKRLFSEPPIPKGGYLLRASNGGSEKFWRWLSKSKQMQADSACLTQEELAAPFSRAALGSVFIKESGFCVKLALECTKLHQIRATDSATDG